MIHTIFQPDQKVLVSVHGATWEDEISYPSLIQPYAGAEYIIKEYKLKSGVTVPAAYVKDIWE